MTIYAMPARPYAQSTPVVGTTGAFAAWLRAARTRKGWSGERLAEEVETSQGTISMYERGLRHPHRERAAELATALGADPREALEALMADTPGLGPAPEIEREVWHEDTLEVAHFYNGIADPRMRDRVKRIMMSAVEIFDEEPEDAGPSGNRTD